MSIFTLRSGVNNHTEASILQLLTDLLTDGGVQDLTATNHFKVSQRGAGANMSVDVAAGRAYVLGTDAYPVRSTDIVNKTVTANPSGNPRIDTIVLYIDKSASPAPSGGGDDVAFLMVVAGTAAASPSAPDDTAVQTAVGASNPYIRLANIAVANGAASIVTANITDVRTPFKLRVNVGSDDEGDIYYRNSDGELARLAIGTEGQKLVVASGVPSWEDDSVVGCILRLSGVQSIPNSAWTPIVWTTEDYDSDAFHSGSADEIVIPVGQAGYYSMSFGVQFNTNTTGYRSAKILVNGADGPYPASRGHDNITGDQSVLSAGTSLIYLDEGDSIEVHVFQTSGGALNVNTDNTFFSIVKVR